jgi:hypothetical protein
VGIDFKVNGYTVKTSGPSDPYLRELRIRWRADTIDLDGTEPSR